MLIITLSQPPRYSNLLFLDLTRMRLHSSSSLSLRSHLGSCDTSDFQLVWQPNWWGGGCVTHRLEAQSTFLWKILLKVKHWGLYNHKQNLKMPLGWEAKTLQETIWSPVAFYLNQKTSMTRMAENLHRQVFTLQKQQHRNEKIPKLLNWWICWTALNLLYM